MAHPKRQNHRLRLMDMIKMFTVCFSVFILILMGFLLVNTSIWNSMVPQFLVDASSEKRYFSTDRFPKIQSNQFLPDTYSGIGLSKKYPYDTTFAYDSPFLSFSLWIRVDAFGEDKISYVFGNRELGCIKGKQGFGYALYIHNKEKRLYLMWKSDRTACEKGVVVNTVPLNEWFHIAVVFTAERDGNTEEDRLSYPTRIEMYYNGDISSTFSSERFISYNDQYYIFGVSPGGHNPFTGRVFHLMWLGYSLSVDEIESIYRGDKEAIQTIKRSAENVIATQYIDSDSLEREEADKVEVYDTKAMMKTLTSRYVSNQVFRPENKGPKTPYVPDPQSVIEFCDYVSSDTVDGDIDVDIAQFIVTLTKKNETRFKEGSYWYRTPESLFQLYSALNHKRVEHIRTSYRYAWSNYKELAWGYDELDPLTGFGNRRWGYVGVTLIGTMDTMYLMGFKDDLELMRNWVDKQFNFNRDFDMSVADMNTHLVGGFLSMYDITKDKLYLNRAIEVADVLLLAFTTYYDYPKPLVNPKKRKGEFKESKENRVFLGDVGALSVEFNYLSRITGDKKYKNAINKINKSLNQLYTLDGLLPSIIRSDTNEAGGYFGMGPNSYRYYEYLLKAWIGGGKRERWLQRKYNAAINGMHKHLLRRSKQGLLYLTEVRDEDDEGKARMSLKECFVGSILSLGVLHNVNPSQRDRDLRTARSLTYTCVRFYLDSPIGVPSEMMEFADDGVKVSKTTSYYRFSPELIESLYYLNQITGDPVYREWGWMIWKSIERETKTFYGYGNIEDVRSRGRIDDTIQHSFYSGMMKYFFLLFKDEQVLDLMNQVITSESHLLSVK